jgi:hypothetical protein
VLRDSKSDTSTCSSKHTFFQVDCFTDSYIQFSASKAPTPQNSAPQCAQEASTREMTDIQSDIAELRVKVADLSFVLANKELELVSANREIARLQSMRP